MDRNKLMAMWRARTFGVLVLVLLLAHQSATTLICKSTISANSAKKIGEQKAFSIDRASYPAKRRVADVFSKLPLRFEANRAQGDNSLKFVARGTGFDFAVEPTEALMRLHSPGRSMAAIPAAMPHSKSASLRMQLVGSNPRARLIGENQVPTRTNYFIGKDPARWETDVLNYARVKVEQAYRGVDVVYYGSDGQLEYDFNVAPGATYKAIRLRFSGADQLAVDESGELVIKTPAATLRQHRPVAYQLVDGVRREIAARYVICREREVGFHIGRYDQNKPLIIDPVLSYSTFFGGEGFDAVFGVAVDALGNTYIAGFTDSSDLTITPGAFQARGGMKQVLTVGFVAKLDPTNNRLVYSTYLGGTIGPIGFFADTRCLALAIDSAGNAYVTGQTRAVDFPTTQNAFRPTLAGGADAFVAKLNTTGSALVYSTYLGSSKAPRPNFEGVDEGLGIAVDAAGSAYVTGRTIGTDFPVTAGALKTAHDNDFGFVGSFDPPVVIFTDAFVTKLNPTGTALIYSTYLGGVGDDTGSSIRVDALGNAYVCGTTRAADFPASNPQASISGGSDAFVAKLNHDGSALVFSTYVGGTGDDMGAALAIDESGNVYFTGTTWSTDLPVTPRAFQLMIAGASIYKSTNSGASWVASNVGIPSNLPIFQLAVDPGNPANLYASTFGTVFRSTDGGSPWKDAFEPRTGEVARPTRVLAFDPKNPATVYAEQEYFPFIHRLLRSGDGGRTWEPIPFFFQTMPVRVFYSLAVDPVNTTTLYVSTEQGLFRTTDQIQWIAASKGLPNNGAAAAILAIDPRDSNWLFARSPELFMSNNAGNRWRPTALGDTTIHNVAFDPINPSIVYASGAGLFKSTDRGESWQEVVNDLPTFGVGQLIIDPGNPLVLYTTTAGDVFKSTDGGLRWKPTNVGPGALAIDPRNPSTLYAYGFVSGSDVFVGKLEPSGSSFSYLTYLGGTGPDSAAGVAVDSAGNAYVTGRADSIDFPVSMALQPDKSYRASNLFITKLHADGAGVAYSTYFGGGFLDIANGIDVDRLGAVYVVGYTSSPDLPLANALQSTFRVTEGFLTRLVDTVPTQPPPIISSVSPSSGSSGGQYEITITGTNFLPGARVRIGGVTVTLIQLTSTRIRGVVNGRSAGVVDVVVSNPDGQSAVLKGGFNFLPLPRITGVSIKGKELAVFGLEFEKGALILIGGSVQKTREEISGFLLSKKAAKKIAPGETALVQVRNANGLTSAPFSYSRPAN